MAARIYKLQDGTRVPSVTTIIGRFKDAQGLIGWAWKEGKEGRDYRETRDQAGDAGSCAHALIEATFRNVPFDGAPYNAEAIQKGSTAFKAFLDWQKESGLVVLHSEVPLVSETHKFGGTLDAILHKVGDGPEALSLGDWKTSNSLYAENLIQLAAYKALWEENNPSQPLTGGFHLVRFGKEDADFEHRFFAELDLAWESFKLMRELYDNDAALKRRMK